MIRREFLVLGLAVVGFVGFAHAADNADPTGTWKWTATMNDQKFDVTLKLKFADDKLTGTVVGRDNQETAIDDATFKDGQIAFSVTRERNGQKFMVKYKGKLDGDKITGKAENNITGQPQTRDWEAKRQKS